MIEALILLCCLTVGGIAGWNSHKYLSNFLTQLNMKVKRNIIVTLKLKNKDAEKLVDLLFDAQSNASTKETKDFAGDLLAHLQTMDKVKIGDTEIYNLNNHKLN
jgi:hypothetical protein